MEEASQLHLERMTWPEVRGALEAGRTTVVVAVGAVEQHGPHLPLFTDAERGTRLAVDVARRLGSALVAPTIRVGCSEHHMAFPGTLSVRADTLRALVRDYCTSLARHGFRRICLVPSHGGNFAPLAHALEELNEAVGPDCRVLAYTDLEGFVRIWEEAVEEVAGLGERVGGHADIAEASEMLVLHPELVKEDEAPEGFLGSLDGEALDRIMKEGFHTLTRNGVLGDARGLSHEIGEACLEAAARALTVYFQESGSPGEEAGVVSAP